MKKQQKKLLKSLRNTNDRKNSMKIVSASNYSVFPKSKTHQSTKP